MFDDLHECYRLLEVEPGASLEEVKTSYRELVKVWHPDRFAHDPKLRDKAVDKLKKINLAYERLREARETVGASAPPSGQRKRARSEREDASRTSERARARRRPAPGPPPPPPSRQARRDVWLQRLRYGGPVAGIVVCGLLIVLRYPKPEPRFLIEVPDEPAPTFAPAPAKGGAAARARPAPMPTLKLPPQKSFGVGSTKEEVIDAQGPPVRATDRLFVYGTSEVHFDDGKVKSWRNGHPRLKVKMVAAANLGGVDYFTVGSTKDQVIHAQGTPDSFTESTFTYGTSRIYFENGKVTSWRVLSRGLRARLLPKGRVGSATSFGVGSTKDEVLAVQGTPDDFTESEFGYGTSRVYFDNGRVRSWHSRSPQLKVEPPA